MEQVTLKLISHDLCLFVQRVVIALNEKNIVHERIDIDLTDKPDWFLTLSPQGKFPVLVITHNDHEHVLLESLVIAEYINSVANINLLDNDTLKAHQRT